MWGFLPSSNRRTYKSQILSKLKTFSHSLSRGWNLGWLYVLCILQKVQIRHPIIRFNIYFFIGGTLSLLFHQMLLKTFVWLLLSQYMLHCHLHDTRQFLFHDVVLFYAVYKEIFPLSQQVCKHYGILLGYTKLCLVN